MRMDSPTELTVSRTPLSIASGFRSTRFPDGSTDSVLSNTSDRAWPMAQHLAAMLGDNA